MRHTFEAEQWLPYPVEAVFDFFANPENLPRLMPSWQRARIEEASFAPPPPRPAGSSGTTRRRGVAAGAGTRMTLSFRPVPYSPVRIPWEAEIVEFAWNDHFCDRQLRGPFAYWRHCHSLRAESQNGTPGTHLQDRVEYEMPLGSLGDLAGRMFATQQFRYIFKYRQQRTAELLAWMYAS